MPKMPMPQVGEMVRVADVRARGPALGVVLEVEDADSGRLRLRLFEDPVNNVAAVTGPYWPRSSVKAGQEGRSWSVVDA